MTLQTVLVRLAVLGAAAGVAHVFFIQFCDLLYRCGCEALWAGAARHCNIHNAAPPHCPWCLDEGLLGQLSFGAIVVSQCALTLWPGRFGVVRAIATFMAFPVVGAIGGLLAGLGTQYWR